MTNNCNHSQCKKSALKEAEKVCEQLGARFTDQRRNVFEILWQNHKAMTAADIMQEMDNKQPPITYRALDFLKKSGLIHHVTSLNAYVGCIHAKDPNHVGQLLICTNCHEIAEIEPENAVSELINEAKSQGFTPSLTHIEMLGLCQDCNNTPS